MSLHIEQAIYPIDGADPALCGKLSIDVHDEFQSAGWAYPFLVRIRTLP